MSNVRQNPPMRPNGKVKRGPGPGGGPPGMMPGEKAKDFKTTIKTLLKYVAPFKWWIVVVIAFAALSTIFSILSPAILGSATDIIVKGVKTGAIDFGAIRNVMLALVVLYLIGFAFQVAQSYIMAGVSQKITYVLRKQISEKLDRLPLRYFDKMTHGEILSRVTNDIETVNNSLSQTLASTISSVTSIIGTLIMMLYMCVPLTITALIVLPTSALLMKVVIGFSQGQFKKQQKYLGELNGHVEEMYTGHTIVKSFSKEVDVVTEFNEINEKLYDSAWKSQFLSGMMMPLTNFVGNLAYVVVCIMGGWLALKGTISIGNIQAFLQYVKNFNHPISQLSNVANILQSTAAAAERIFELLDEEEEVAPIDLEEEAREEKKRAQGAVTFEHVKFGYKEHKPLIKDFSFEVKPGQRIAIVGPTGAGKTTIVKLLLRFYELNGGRILIDGKDIKDYTRYELRNMFGMVLQDTWLFKGTVMENIRYGKLDATDEEVHEAAKEAFVDHFIRTQPKGYEMEITEDAGNISQGQRQLLTIARAFLADAPILILDEATSSVDTRTEAKIQEAMNALMKDRTSFVIAHRLSTIKDADVILVINRGDIVEYGTHYELLEKGGFYANMYNSQF